MESKKLMDALEAGLVKKAKDGDFFNIPYDSRVDVSVDLRKAYKNIDFKRLESKVTKLLEEELARKLVNKIVTELGTDIKKLMSNPHIRDDFKYFLRCGIEEIMSRVSDKKPNEVD